MIWLWSPAAWADPPTDLVRLWQIGDGNGEEVERMTVSQGGDFVVGRTRADKKGWVLDVDGWDLQSLPASCDVTGVAPVPFSDGTWEFWVSCGDGSLQAFTYVKGSLAAVKDSEDKPLTIEGVATSLSGIWYDGSSQLLYAVEVPATGGQPYTASVHAIDPGTLAVDSAIHISYPKPLVAAGFNEGVVHNGRLVVSHGEGRMSTVPLGTAGGAAVPNQPLGGFRCDDLAAGPVGQDAVYCVDSTASGGLGAAYRYNYLQALNQFQPLTLGELPDPRAICVSENLNDGWLAIMGMQVQVWAMDANGTIPSTTPVHTSDPDANNPIRDAVASEGYLFGGGIGGNLHIVTERPWVYPDLSVEPVSLKAGDTAVVTFKADEAVSWKLTRGGDRRGEGGVLLGSGNAAKEETVSVDLTIDERYAEGANDLYVVVTSNETGLTGHGRLTILVDNPPKPPALKDRNVQFADGGLVLTFEGIPDEDLTAYEIYVSDAPFKGEDYPTGGPEFEGGFKSPIVLDDVAPGSRVSHRIAPLTNGVTYYIGVRARDANKEGPMSNVVKGTPQRTYTAAELAGDPGGSPCSTGPSLGQLSWLAVALGGLLVRRRGMAAPALVLALAGSVLPGVAQAREDEDPWWRQDMTPARANFAIRYGSIALVDDRIDRIYKNGAHNLLQAEVGPQLFRYAEIDFGFGFFQEIAKTTTMDGKPSADVTMLTMFPLSLDVTGRAHVLDEQPVVPYFRYGWDYVLWSEKQDDGFGGKEVLRGAKFGTHTGLGVDLLLDLLAPGRASFLEAQTGINDSWITIEWRRQNVDARRRPWSGRNAPDDRLDFSGDAVMVGLKLDW